MSHIDPPITEHFIAGKYVWDCLCHLILWPVMEYIGCFDNTSIITNLKMSKVYKIKTVLKTYKLILK